MDIFEYSEAHWPTRALQQEEEEQAESTAAAYLEEPEVTWADSTKLVDGALQTELLVIATTEGACALLDHCLPDLKEIGSIAPSAAIGGGAEPGIDLDVIYGGAVSAAGRRRRASSILASPAVTAVACREDVPAERAGAWARAVLRVLRPGRVLMLGSMPAEHYRGGGDPSQEFLAFVLETSAARQQQQQQQQQKAAAAPPLLPSGSLVAGLPAALLTACELRGVPAQLLVSVDQVVALLPDALPAFAAAAAALLAGKGAGATAVAAALGDAARVSAAREALEHTSARARGTGAVYA